jgi:hypothetical protein
MITHEPKFNYSIPALKSYNKFFNDDHIYIVFSSEHDKDIFTSLAGDIPFRPLIYDSKKEGDPYIIMGKTIFGIREVFNNSEFDKIALIDSEVLFYRHMDYDKLFTEHLNSKTVYANRILPSIPKQYCLIGSYNFFNLEDQIKIKNVLLHDELFFFFNNIPIYSKEHFYNFLNYINYDQSKAKFNFHTFVYMIYTYYLIIKDCINIEILNYKGNNYYHDMGILEWQAKYDQNMFNEIFNSYNPMWSELPVKDPKNAFMLLGLDRNPNFKEHMLPQY